MAKCAICDKTVSNR